MTYFTYRIRRMRAHLIRKIFDIFSMKSLAQNQFFRSNKPDLRSWGTGKRETSKRQLVKTEIVWTINAFRARIKLDYKHRIGSHPVWQKTLMEKKYDRTTFAQEFMTKSVFCHTCWPAKFKNKYCLKVHLNDALFFWKVYRMLKSLLVCGKKWTMDCSESILVYYVTHQSARRGSLKRRRKCISRNKNFAFDSDSFANYT